MRLHGIEYVSYPGSLDYIKELDYKRCFIVTGKSSMFKNKTIDRLEKILEANNCQYRVFSGIGANPTDREVIEGANEMKEFKPDAVIGLGGGSAIDASKVMLLLYEHPHLTFEIIRKSLDMNISRNIGLIAIPSTSGTGSEMTKTSVITFGEDNIKIGLKAYSFIPDYTILDGEITLSMPKDVVAETGMDAMTHAVECYTNKNVEDFSEVLCRGAVEGLFEYLPLSYEKGDIESRQKVHNYQSMAAMAFHNIGLGMDHGIFHSIGGMFHYGHGLINAVGLPYVLSYNSRDPFVQKRLNRLAKAIGQEDFIESIKNLNHRLDIPKSFKEMGILEDAFLSQYDEVLDNAMLGSTRGNPVKMTRQEMDKVLKSIYYGKILF